jgi:hypothetical protein
MHPDVHLVRTRPPILDVPPLVWIDPPGAPKVAVPSAPSGPLWEWPQPPTSPPRQRLPLVRLGVVLAVIVLALGIALVDGPAAPAPISLPVPDEPVWCACQWWPSGPAGTA